MSGADKRSFDTPDESMDFELGHTDAVTIGDRTVGRSVLEPGWRWSEHIKPIVGTEWCESSHVGVVLSGRFAAVTRDGLEMEFGPNEVYELRPGHDAWVVGEEPAIAIEWSGVRGWAEPLESFNQRVLSTLVLTDVVDSTSLAERIGDGAWRELLARHGARARELVARFRGRAVKDTGDGLLAAFDGAARALRCAAELVRPAGEDLPIRVAVHTGEVELVGDDVRGVAVHEAARVLGLAGANQILVTALTKDLASAAGMTFTDAGEHELKGLEGPRRIYALAPPG